MQNNTKFQHVVTTLGMPPTRAPAPALTRAQLVAMAAGGADDGASLSAASVAQICHDYMDTVVELHLEEQLAEQRYADAAVAIEELRRQLAAERARGAALQRQVALKIQAFALSVLTVEMSPRSDFDEPTRRARSPYAAVVRRESSTKVIDVHCVEVRP